MATESYWCPGPLPWEWFRTCTREVPDSPDPCNAAECVNAKARFIDAYGRFKATCDYLRGLRAVEKALRSIGNAPIDIVTVVVLALISLVLSLIAPELATIIGIFIFTLIILYGISRLLLLAIGKMGQSLSMALYQARFDMNNAHRDVIANCPEHCRGDISIPECQID